MGHAEACWHATGVNSDVTFGPPVLTFASGPTRPGDRLLKQNPLLGVKCCRGMDRGARPGAGGVPMERVIIATCRSDGSGPYRVYPRGSRWALASSAFAVEVSDGPAGKSRSRERKGRRST